VTVEACIPGATKQQWRVGVGRELQLRLNGLVAEVNMASPLGSSHTLGTRRSRDDLALEEP
jgi:hypothetical protein